MHIQFNTDDTIEGRDALAAQAEADIRTSLGRFADQITRIEIHLSDVNGDKTASNDKRCLIEARLAGRQPEAVSHEGATMDAAVNGAVKKLRRSLDGTLGRLGDHKGAPSIRTSL